MLQRGGLGLLSWLLVLFAGCSSPATPEHSAPRAGGPAIPAKTGDSAIPAVVETRTGEEGPAQAIVIQFVDAPSGLMVSCEGCPGLPSKQRYKAHEFPPLRAPLGTRVTLELVALGFVAQKREVDLDSTRVVVPASLERL